MKKILSFVFVSLFIVASLIFFAIPNHADELDDLTKQINDLNSALNQSVNATRPLESQLNSMQQQIADIKARVTNIENDVAQKQINIDNGYKDLETKQDLLNRTIRDFYIKSYYDNPLIILLSARSAAQITQVLAYQEAATNADKSIITNIALTITDLENKKAALEDEKSRLTVLKASLDDQSAKLDKIVSGAKAYQASLSSQIAQLSAQQQALLAQKYGSLGIPTTAYTSNKGCSSDLTNGRDPGFSPAFGFFTYGVYHRVGMSQYGAKGRADAGGDSGKYQNILSFYYPNTQITTVGSMTITVNGTNDYSETFNNQSFSIEDYLTHIYEMPSDWNPEALKAQAVAARTYAVQAVQSGKTTVLPNQSFQEVKTEQNSQAWISAVNATTGQVLTSGGSTITAWFSSTGGGYTHNSGDVFGSSTDYTKTSSDGSGSINSFTDLQNNAYDGPHYANSPWFYCDWGSRSQYAGTAWLKPSEVADIVNVILLAQKDNSTASHLSQPDGNVPDTWSPDQVKQELRNRGVTPFNSISSISVNPDFGAGKITNVTVNGDAGSLPPISGDTFVTYFDVRAPANIFIPSLKKNPDGSYVSPLFNVETR